MHVPESSSPEDTPADDSSVSISESDNEERSSADVIGVKGGAVIELVSESVSELEELELELELRSSSEILQAELLAALALPCSFCK